MKEKYIPPFDITNKMLELVSTIMENLGKISTLTNLDKFPRLRKVGRLKSIHSSLAIENNTLSLEQVTEVINGKRVLAPEEDIIAVKNAYKTYDLINIIDPYNVKDLLKAHKLMMQDLVEENGQFRTNNVGVFDNAGLIIHMAPPPNMVKELVENLFDFIKNSDVHMLIKSSVFHYEFEFIHPFRDGNGRMGRLWQTALLAAWKPIFKWIPIETIIKDNQEDYYRAIAKSTQEAKSNEFIIFMLEIIEKAIHIFSTDAQNHIERINIQVEKLMEVIDYYPQSAKEIMKKLNLTSRNNFRNNYLVPALKQGLIKQTHPDNPTSKNQRYYKAD